MLPNQSGDTRNAFIDALVSCLLKVKETLAAQQGSIDEMLQLTALLGNHHWEKIVEL
jgi:c-di-GMP-related signal transduction protein